MQSLEIGGNTVRAWIGTSGSFWGEETRRGRARVIEKQVTLMETHFESLLAFAGLRVAHVVEMFGELKFLNAVAVTAVRDGQELIRFGKYVPYRHIMGEKKYRVIRERLIELESDEDYGGVMSGVKDLVEATTRKQAHEAIKRLEREAKKLYNEGKPVILVTGGSYFSVPKSNDKLAQIIEPEAYLGMPVGDPQTLQYLEDAEAAYRQIHSVKRLKWNTMVMNYWGGWGVALAAPATGQSLESGGLIMFENLIKTEKWVIQAFKDFDRPLPADWRKYIFILYLHHEAEHNWYPKLSGLNKKGIYEEVASDLFAVNNVLTLICCKRKGYEDFSLSDAVLCILAEFRKCAYEQPWGEKENENGYVLTGRVMLDLMHKSGLVGETLDISRLPHFQKLLAETYRILLRSPGILLTKYGGKHV